MIESTSSHPLFQPASEANQTLRKNVAPPDWPNPTPAKRYNVVVIGAGSGGLVTAAAVAGLGGKVALIEKHALGGDCLNVGCVPSKALLSAAKQIAAARKTKDSPFLKHSSPEVDFPALMEKMRELRAQIAPHDSAERFRDLGVDIFFGEAKFTDRETVTVNGQNLKFAKAVVATGGRAIVLPIPGLAEAGALTNETLFSLTEQPESLAIIGAGPIGCEMAQAFARFGTKVTLFESECRILPREDTEASEIVRAQLHEEGVVSRCEIALKKVEKQEDGQKVITLEHEGKTETLTFAEVLVGVGRAPNVEGIGLETVGVEFDKRTGIKVNERLQTTNPKIFAIGDVAMKYKFTHMAGATARLVIQNALFGGRKKHTDLLVPWSTYTQPEISHVGLYENEAKEKYGENVQTFTQPFADMDRNIVDEKTKGFVKVHAHKGRIVGATIVGENAGDLISEITVAMQSRMKLGALSNVIHPYPTAAEAIQRIGDAYNKTRFTPFLQKAFRWWLKRSRGGV
ncbi:MAG: mercuric reductase [Opitutales bacterium]|nr:mercuric reductase [Opitutales bacterium]